MKFLLFGIPKFLAGPRFLFGAMFFGLLGGVATMRVWDFFLGGPTSAVANVARPAIFLSTMTAISTKLGMNKFTSKIRGVRHVVESGRNEQSLGEKNDG